MLEKLAPICAQPFTGYGFESTIDKLAPADLVFHCATKKLVSTKTKWGGMRPRRFGQSLFAAIVLTLAQSVARADIAADLNYAFLSACGSTPQQSCAMNFWSNAFDQWFDVATGYYHMHNDPGFNAWCAWYPAECEQFSLEWGVAIAASEYCLANWEYWNNGGR